MKRKYLVLIERGPTSYGAYAPDVPGCGTSGDTREEALANIKEALELHLEAMAESGEKLPEATCETAAYIEVEIPRRLVFPT
jgi:predicted RNase H-like HicB family nuclease